MNPFLCQLELLKIHSDYYYVMLQFKSRYYSRGIKAVRE